MTEFPQLAALAARCGYTEIVGGLGYDHEVDANGRRRLNYVVGDVETLVHELCHWAIATDEERLQPNLALDGWMETPARLDDADTEPLVFWLELTAFAMAEVEWLIAYEDDVGWEQRPEFLALDARSVQMHHRWINVPSWFQAELADALRSDCPKP